MDFPILIEYDDPRSPPDVGSGRDARDAECEVRGMGFTTNNGESTMKMCGTY